jgi:hypothetical protein
LAILATMTYSTSMLINSCYSCYFMTKISKFAWRERERERERDLKRASSSKSFLLVIPISKTLFRDSTPSI